jgi:hypothetical protein
VRALVDLIQPVEPLFSATMPISHAQAKQEVHDSEVWRDRKLADESFHERRWNEFEEISKSLQSGIALTDFEPEIRPLQDDEERKP